MPKAGERLYDFLEMLQERRIGFKMSEIMQGTHRFKAGPRTNIDLPMSFRVSWGAKNLQSFLYDFFCARPAACALAGTADIEGICKNAEVSGRLEFRYLVDATLHYEFVFTAHGSNFLFMGDKENIRPWNLHRTHTRLYGIIVNTDTHRVVSSCTVYFNLRTLPKFLASCRLA